MGFVERIKYVGRIVSQQMSCWRQCFGFQRPVDVLVAFILYARYLPMRKYMQGLRAFKSCRDKGRGQNMRAEF